MTMTTIQHQPSSKVAIAVRLFVFIVMAVILTVAQAAAQSRAAGEIRGTVLDASGAAVPGVAIILQNQFTSVITRIKSNDAGVFDFASVDPGTYRVTFEKEGFKKFVKSDIVLHIEAITINTTLEVGAVTQQVEVKGGAPLVQTETSDKAETITAAAISELPSVSRDWFDYTYLLPGAEVGNPGNKGTSGGVVGGPATGFNGQGQYQLLGLMDGGIATALPGNNYNVVPIQAIDQVQMETSNYTAEYGSGLGVFNVILKSGTNKFHGEGFEFVQNDKLDARNFFNLGQIPTVRWNMFGGAVGGPIKKDKLFFFFAFQRNPNIGHTSSILSMPTAAEEQGDLSGLGVAIYDPNTLVQNADGTYSRTQFAGNIIPNGTNGPNRIDPAAAKILSYYPTPNIPGAGYVNNYYYAAPTPIITDTFDWKMNYNISSGNRLNVSQNYIDYNSGDAGWAVSPTCSEKIDCVNSYQHNQTDVISDVWSINSNLVNEFRASLNRYYSPYVSVDMGKDWGSTLGIANLTANAFPIMSISGAGAPYSIGSENSFKHAVLGYATIVEADTLTLIKGKHILKFGGEYNSSRTNDSWGDVNPGEFAFTGEFSSDPSNASSTGSGMADFLLGVPGSWSDSWTPAVGYRTGNAQAFAQDDFKVTPRLTLNLGVRWLDQRGYTEQFDRVGSFDPTITNPATGTLGAMWYGGQKVGVRAGDSNSALEATIPLFFMPRLGFAWSPKDNWAIRGAYGIFANQEYGSGASYSAGEGLGVAVSGYDASSLQAQPLIPFMTLSGGHAPPVIPAFPPSASFYNGSTVPMLNYHIPQSYVQQWHFSVQHQLSNSTMVEVGYVGARAVHLNDPSDLDQVPTNLIQQYGAIGVNMQQYRPYPQYTGITYSAWGGWSSYNSLQVTFKRNMSHGLTLQTSYTYSKSMDTNTQSGWGGAEGAWQIQLNPAAQYGNSQVDQPNHWNGMFVYQLPFGMGRTLLNKGGIVNGVLGGWQLSNTWDAFSGNPFTPVWGGPNYDFSGSGSWLPNRVCNGALNSPSIHGWFNLACFPVAANGTFGNSGRDILFGPGFFNMNTSLAKDFKLRYLGEAGLIQIRIDATDVLNHPNFGQPNTAVTPAPTAAGTITSSVSQRIVQLGARIVF